MTFNPRDPDRDYPFGTRTDRTAAWIIGGLTILIVAVAIVWAVDENSLQTASGGSPATTIGQSADSQKPSNTQKSDSVPQTNQTSKEQ